MQETKRQAAMRGSGLREEKVFTWNLRDEGETALHTLCMCDESSLIHTFNNFFAQCHEYCLTLFFVTYAVYPALYCTL
jgi:hypothetical protein